MKLVTMEHAGAQRIGAILDGGATVIDLARGAAELGWEPGRTLSDMLALMEAGDRGLDLARKVVSAAPDAAILPVSQVHLRAPVPVPAQMRDCLAFEKHLRNGTAAMARRLCRDQADPDAAMERLKKSGALEIHPVWFEQPIYYKQNRFSVSGPEDDILWPRYSNWRDYELELGVFIGRKGRDIPAASAGEHIFGYVIFNDFSARDAQFKEMPVRCGPAKGKDFDTGNALGPWLVTKDEIPDPYNLTMIARVNGKEWSRGNSGEIHHRFERMVEHISQSETLHVGEFIGSGTVGGGCGLELDRELVHGDIVELEISGLGILRNRIVVQ